MKVQRIFTGFLSVVFLLANGCVAPGRSGVFIYRIKSTRCELFQKSEFPLRITDQASDTSFKKIDYTPCEEKILIYAKDVGLFRDQDEFFDISLDVKDDCEMLVGVSYRYTIGFSDPKERDPCKTLDSVDCKLLTVELEKRRDLFLSVLSDSLKFKYVGAPKFVRHISGVSEEQVEHFCGTKTH